MSEQSNLKQEPDLRTDAQRFEDALRVSLRAPKAKVDAMIAEEKANKQK
ncbi:MAG TPA: hypothetical protein VFA07_03685 [Chthonomonadaceae bacterium]|nr:hypothetical protein [Chthonomonadaceae bacterium]